MVANATRMLLILLVVAMVAAAAGSQPIGVVRAGGEFRLDDAAVRGNGTLFDGNTVQSVGVRTELRIGTGAQLTLAPNSKSQVFKDHAVLQAGAVELAGLRLEARGLTIAPGDGAAQVMLNASDSRVRVAATKGEVSVRNREGVLVARLMPGRGLEFDPQAGASAATKMKGKLKKVDGKYFLTDEATNVTAEVRGNNLDKYVGKAIIVTGSLVPGAVVAAGATQVVAVTDVSVAAAAAAAGGAGLSGVATAAIIGGVSVAGTVGGLAAAGSFSGDDTPASR